MAEKPPEEVYISVVDEEPEILSLLWDNNTPQMQKHHEPVQQTPVEKPKRPEKRSSKLHDCDPFDMPEPDFIETYRLSKELVRALCAEIKPVIAESSKSVDFSLESKVLLALAFYATGKYQKLSASKSDPSFSVHFTNTSVIQVTEAMNHPSIVKKYIHFPHLKEERDIIKARFYIKYGMPNVVGCVDCTHVPIAKPEDDQKSHYNKSYHSKKVQIICDSSLTITSVHLGGGAASHDSLLARHPASIDLRSLNAAAEPCWLVGGPHYSQKPYIMAPIPKISKKGQMSPEKYYNYVHNETHSAVSETIKHLKSRWKSLQATCHRHIDPATVSMMVVACCVLHNICNNHGLPVCTMTQAEERLEVMKQKVANGPVSKLVNSDTEGVQVRAQLAERLWNERRDVPEQRKKRQSKREKPPPPPQPTPLPTLQTLHTLTPPVEDPKRPRMNMNGPTYEMLQPVWGHHYHHHH